MLQLRASSIADTHAIANGMASLTRAGDVVILAGEMGAGKTAFAQGFGRAFGIDEPITSPTYTLVHSYDLAAPVRGVRTLHHADLYRLDRTSEVADLALFELAEFGGIVLIEWGDVVESTFGDHLVVHLARDADDDTSDEFVLDEARIFHLSGAGPTWAARWERLTATLEEFSC
jgi:tRNA threonylcarbamoyladenosine biosynthesis protein TsaE